MVAACTAGKGRQGRGMSSNQEYFVPPAVQQVQDEQLDAVTALVIIM